MKWRKWASTCPQQMLVAPPMNGMSINGHWALQTALPRSVTSLDSIMEVYRLFLKGKSMSVSCLIAWVFELIHWQTVSVLSSDTPLPSEVVGLAVGFIPLLKTFIIQRSANRNANKGISEQPSPLNQLQRFPWRFLFFFPVQEKMSYSGASSH